MSIDLDFGARSPDFPRHWWVADDGRAFSAASGQILDKEDLDYIAWTEAGHVATRWPRDAASRQTTAALDAVLAYYSIARVA